MRRTLNQRWTALGCGLVFLFGGTIGGELDGGAQDKAGKQENQQDGKKPRPKAGAQSPRNAARTITSTFPRTAGLIQYLETNDPSMHAAATLWSNASVGAVDGRSSVRPSLQPSPGGRQSGVVQPSVSQVTSLAQQR